MNIISVRKIQIFSLFFILAQVIFTIGDLKAGESNKTDKIKLYPLSKAPSVQSTIKSKQAVGPTVAKIEAQLRKHVASLKKNTKQQGIKKNQLTTRQNKALKKLRERAGLAIELRMSDAGTPRQIKGKVLGPASQKAISRSDNDEETALNFLRSNSALLCIDNTDSELILRKKHRDKLGMRHLKFSQKHLGLSVWPAELIIHLDLAGNVYLMNGAFVPTPEIKDTKPSIDAETAVTLARNEVAGGREAVVNSPELIVYAPGNSGPRLAWKMEVNVSFASNWLIVADALNGTILTSYNQVMDTATTGSGVDLLGATQSINLWEESGVYYTVDGSKQMFDPDSGAPNPNTTKGGIIILDAANLESSDSNFTLSVVNSTSATSGWLPEAVSASLNLSITYDYFLNRHGRNSLDDNGGTLYGVVRWGEDYSNAFFNPESNIMAFGDGEMFAGALDVTGHEMTHGVTFNTANLLYQNQSGALNEAFSDIFGESIEAITKGSHDWLIGDVLPDIYQRSMSDPSSLPNPLGGYYPSKMSEYFNTTEDNGGVHINSGIINNAFYLLAQGLNGAIGDLDAEKIFYRALTTHLVTRSQFVDARFACIQSAEELFGAGSDQALRTADAFDAVEIFGGSSTPESPVISAVDSSDSTLFLFYDQSYASYFLARQEDALGDSPNGVALLNSSGSGISVAAARPSVSGDGSYTVFVTSDNDMCFYGTDGQSSELCLGLPGTVASTSMSPDGEIYAYVLLNNLGNPYNSIVVIDLRPGGETKTYTLVAPAIDGTSTNTIVRAGNMDFSLDGQLLFYDALNRIRFSNGIKRDVWSIYAIDLNTGLTFTITPPVAGLTSGFPSLSQTSDKFITFDVHDDSTGQSTIYAGNLITGDLSSIATVTNGFGVPSYTGDDTAIVYSQYDPTVQTLFSLYQQQLESDNISPDGQPTLRLSDGDLGAIYRRGTFAGVNPTPDIKANASNGPINIDGNLTVTIELGSGTYTGQEVEWWVAAETSPFGWFYFNGSTSSWVNVENSLAGLSYTYQKPLSNLSPLEVLVLDMSGLPKGTYTFYFAIDTKVNGTLDLDSLYYDFVEVIKTQ